MNSNDSNVKVLHSFSSAECSSDVSSADDGNRTRGFTLHEKKGDLFKESGAGDSLAHCVSVDLRMGKGIAPVFKNRFGGLDELKSQNVKIGGVGVLRREGRFIYYLITKEKYNDKPTYDSVKASLCAMRDHCVTHHVQQLGMPRIGCGLDRLQWPHVRKDIEDVFMDTDVTVTVYSLD